jgi:hypothetical protein
MRTFVLLPMAAATLATTAAIGAWSLGSASSRIEAFDQQQAPVAISQQAAADTIEVPTTRPQLIAFRRYRTEACSGDYVCRDGGAWDPATGASTETWLLTSDGF